MKKNKFKDFFKYKLPYFFKVTLLIPFRYIHNFFFCLKYPFWKMRNVFTDKFCGYRFTWYDSIPRGWKKAFGKQLSKDLKKALSNKKCNQLKGFRFVQVKEKYGTLRLYCNGTTKEVYDVLTKYELLSMCYCINCGKPVRYITNGWINYLCEDCAKEVEDKERLTKDDLPLIEDDEGEIHIKLTYGIDFIKMWGLDCGK